MSTSLAVATVETTRSLNVLLQPFNGYFNLFPLYPLCAAVETLNLDSAKVLEAFQANQDSGRMNVALSSDIYLCVTWYRLESGRYEVVAYASSNFDDSVPYNEPKWTAAEKRNKLNKLNSQLRVLRSYYASKGLYAADVCDLLAAGKFDTTELLSTGFPNGEGRVNVEVGQNCFLVVTWYQMPSGSYEMTAYATAG